MGFKGITDEKIAEELKKRSGIARPGAKEFLLDALSFAPALLGMPMGVYRVPLPMKKLPSGKYGLIPRREILEGASKKLDDTLTKELKKKPQNIKLLKKIRKSWEKVDSQLEDTHTYEGLREEIAGGISEKDLESYFVGPADGGMISEMLTPSKLRSAGVGYAGPKRIEYKRIK
jgi:hypothetical protein